MSTSAICLHRSALLKKNISAQILISMVMFKLKNYYGLDPSGIIVLIKMTFMSLVLLVGFFAGVQACQVVHGLRPTMQKNTRLILKGLLVSFLISMIRLRWISFSIRIIVSLISSLC